MAFLVYRVSLYVGIGAEGVVRLGKRTGSAHDPTDQHPVTLRQNAPRDRKA